MKKAPANKPEKIIIAAVAENGVIGRDGKIPWHLPEEQALFRRLTLGHTLIMGRDTFASIGRPLDGRRNIVVSRTLAPRPDIDVCRSFSEALHLAEKAGRQIFFLGGVDIYQKALSLADRMLISRISGTFSGDTYFPAFTREQWHLVEEQQHETFILQIYLPVARKIRV